MPAMSEERKLAHDLRHLVTLAELECELGGPQEFRTVLARLRARCDVELDPSRAVQVELDQLLEELVGELRTLHPQARIVLEPLLALPGCTLAAGALRRLLRNLMLNALEAGGDLECGVELKNGMLQIALRDNARGIPRDQLSACLGGGRSHHGSTGLGTASVEECARILRASVRVRALAPQGTEFRISIPLAGRPG